MHRYYRCGRPIAPSIATCFFAWLLVWTASFSVGDVVGRAAAAETASYHDGRALVSALKQLDRQSGRVALHELGKSPGGQKIRLLEIAPAGDSADGSAKGPALLVIANPLGTTPLATEAALRLAQALATTTDGRAAAVTWHIVPAANPDAMDRFFARPGAEDGRNQTPVDDDRDGAYAEDAPDDLDGDGLITTMLLDEPSGRWLLTDDEPRLLRQADPTKGETGGLSRESEGQDDDGDGRWNEDASGGVIVGRNFPHGFVPWTDAYGRWAADQPESRALLAYAFAHPEIAVILVLGEANTLLQVPTARHTSLDSDRLYPIPRWVARATGLDPTKQYRLDTLVPVTRDALRRPQLSAADVLAMIGSDAAAEPDPADLKWWSAIAGQYSQRLKEIGLDGPRVDPPASGPGSLQEWGYYQFGVPSFALDFWSVPLPAVATADSAAAGGAAAPRPAGPRELAAGTPAGAAMISATAEAAVDTATQRALITFGAAYPDWQGYRPWSEVTLPDGREVLVGGALPFALRTPPSVLIDSLLTPQIPLLLEFADWLPDLTLTEVKLDHRGSGIYQLTAYLRNESRIPFPTAQGVRCRRPPPVAITLSGAVVLGGNARQVIAKIPALSVAEVSWLIEGKSGTRVTLKAEAPVMVTAHKTVVLDEKGGRR